MKEIGLTALFLLIYMAIAFIIAFIATWLDKRKEKKGGN